MLHMILLALVIAAMIILVLFGEGESIAGIAPSLFASLLTTGIVGFLVLGWAVSDFQGRWREAARNAALWVIILFGLLTAYAYRFEAQDVMNRVLATVAPGYVVMARGGEMIVTRNNAGSFVMAGRINGREARFLFDTGASSVVLTQATARAAGINLADLTYNVTVSTANGRTTAARVRLDRLDIGAISETRVDALVAQPGALGQNLLGMSFLDRLSSYEVRDDRLIMRGGR